MTVAQILEIEGHAEDAFVNLLRPCLPPPVNGSQVNIFPSRTSLTSETPSLEIKVVSGEPNKDHEYIFPGNPNIQVYDTYEGELLVTVTTNRTTDETAPSHRRLLGLLRSKLNYKLFARTNFESPVLFLIDCRENGTVDSVEGVDNTDVSVLSWFLMVQIQPDVWPANP